MRATISFLPIDPGHFARTFDALLSGEPVDPGTYLDAACRLRRIALTAARFSRAIEAAIQQAQPPPLPTDGPLWLRVKARLDRFDHRPSAFASRVTTSIDPDLHLYGRPFFITEGSAEAVSSLVKGYLSAGGAASVESIALEQVVKLDAEAAKGFHPLDGPDETSDLPYRAKLSAALRSLTELSRRARPGGAKNAGGDWNTKAEMSLADEICWRAVYLYGRSVPVWIGRNVDGLATICRFAGVAPPSVLVAPSAIFDRALQLIPALRSSFHVEMERPRDVGGYVAPRDVPRLLDFVHQEGARIIRAAAKSGEGRLCSTLLHKIRECAEFAGRTGCGYLEASGVDRVEDDWDPDRGEGDAMSPLLDLELVVDS